MENLSTFPTQLKDLMLFHDHLESKALGEAIGISPSNVRSWLRGATLPTLASAVKIADYFGCSLDYLAGRKEYEEVTPRTLPPFYEQLRKVMKERDISRYYFDEKTDFQDGYFVKWSKGSPPNLITVVKLAKILDVSIDYLVGRRDY